jgi:7,8-dihydropterin-6-yl-methyl-4-(beta-D-ribofuranosyl)aminobenzene 5'-phosphate synthase
MIVKTLSENTAVSDEFKNEHGLSLYIETEKHKLLFDLGASAIFVENAYKLDVDLAEVDLVIISHGHYDHGGGLRAFLHLNDKAKIFLSRKAFGRYYSNRPGGEKAYIGLDVGLIKSDRFIFTMDRFVIDDELELFSNVEGMRFYPSGNRGLLMESGASLLPDDFAHEQNLVIREGGKTLLAAGCAHRGIVNIIDHMINAKMSLPHHVIGGFHLYSRPAGRHEEPTIIRQIGEYLKNTGAKYYTCHCTGPEPFKILKEIMGEHIQYLAAGSQLTI